MYHLSSQVASLHLMLGFESNFLDVLANFIATFFEHASAPNCRSNTMSVLPMKGWT